jgi:hypothetical protein
MYWPSSSNPHRKREEEEEASPSLSKSNARAVPCDEVSLQSWMQNVNKSPLMALRKAAQTEEEERRKACHHHHHPNRGVGGVGGETKVMIRDLRDWENFKMQELLCMMEGGWEGTRKPIGKEAPSFEPRPPRVSQSQTQSALPTSCSAEVDCWDDGLAPEHVKCCSRRGKQQSSPESTRAALRVLEERRQNLILTPLPPAVSRKLAESSISSPARLTWPKAEPDHFLRVFSPAIDPTLSHNFANDENLTSLRDHLRQPKKKEEGRVNRSQKRQLLCKLAQFERKLHLASKQVGVDRRL